MPNSVLRQLNEDPTVVYMIWGRAIEQYSLMGLHASTTVPPCGYHHCFRVHTASVRCPDAKTPVAFSEGGTSKIYALKHPSCIDCSMLLDAARREKTIVQKETIWTLFVLFFNDCACPLDSDAGVLLFNQIVFPSNSHPILSMASVYFIYLFF